MHDPLVTIDCNEQVFFICGIYSWTDNKKNYFKITIKKLSIEKVIGTSKIDDLNVLASTRDPFRLIQNQNY